MKAQLEQLQKWGSTQAHHFGLLVSILLPYYSGLYLMAPGITIEGDSGELAAAVYGFGVIHSPGFPSYMVVAKLLERLLFFLPTAQTTNLLSMLNACACSALMYLCARQFNLKPFIACTLAVLFTFSSEFWYQSLITEVYSFALMILLSLVYALMNLNSENWARRLPWLALLLTFGIGAHVYIWAFTPVFLYLIWKVSKNSPKSLNWLKTAVGAALGLMPYAYIPLRAGHFPAVDQGHINSFSRFFEHVTWGLQRDRQGAALGSGFNLSDWLSVKGTQFHYFFEEAVKQWNWLFLIPLCLSLIAFLPASRLKKHLDLDVSQNQDWNWTRLMAFLCLFYLGIIWLIFAGPELSLSVMGEMQVHMITLYAFLVLTLGGVLRAIEESSFFKDHMPSQTLSALLALALLVQVHQRWRDSNLSVNQLAEAHGSALLTPLEPKAILFGFGDNDLMPPVYMQSVHKVRPDVKVINMAINTRWYYESLREMHPDLSWPEYTPQFATRLINLNAEKFPIYVSNNLVALQLNSNEDFKRNFKFYPSAGVYRLLRLTQDPQIALNSPSPGIKIPPEPTLLRPREYDVIAQYADYQLRLAEAWLQLGQTDKALREVELGLNRYPQGPTPFSQIIHRELEKVGNQIMASRNSMQKEPASTKPAGQ